MPLGVESSLLLGLSPQPRRSEGAFRPQQSQMHRGPVFQTTLDFLKKEKEFETALLVGHWFSELGAGDFLTAHAGLPTARMRPVPREVWKGSALISCHLQPPQTLQGLRGPVAGGHCALGPALTPGSPLCKVLLAAVAKRS